MDGSSQCIVDGNSISKNTVAARPSHRLRGTFRADLWPVRQAAHGTKFSRPTFPLNILILHAPVFKPIRYLFSTLTSSINIHLPAQPSRSEVRVVITTNSHYFIHTEAHLHSEKNATWQEEKANPPEERLVPRRQQQRVRSRTLPKLACR